MARRLSVLVVLLCAACIHGGSSQHPGTPAAPPAGRLCGSLAGQHERIAHVLLIVMENRSAAQVGQLPTVRSLARRCGSASDFHAVTHPSLGNYLAMTGGAIPDGVRGTDCSPSPSCSSPGPDIFSQAGSWRVWAESMPGDCSTQTAGRYAVRHTAAPYYEDLRATCPSNQVPLEDPRSGLAAALRAGALPRFALIVPDMTDDMHDGCDSCGDAWLARWLPRIARSRAYTAGTVAVFVTWDEDDGSADNRVALFALSPYTRPGSVVRRPADDYGLLRTMEGLLGLPPLGQAARRPDVLGSLVGEAG